MFFILRAFITVNMNFYNCLSFSLRLPQSIISRALIFSFSVIPLCRDATHSGFCALAAGLTEKLSLTADLLDVSVGLGTDKVEKRRRRGGRWQAKGGIRLVLFSFFLFCLLQKPGPRSWFIRWNKWKHVLHYVHLSTYFSIKIKQWKVKYSYEFPQLTVVTVNVL